MHYNVHCHSCKGQPSDNQRNQALTLRSFTSIGEVLLSVICRGMGKENGAKAAAFTLEAFRSWFDIEMQSCLQNKNYLECIQLQWKHLLEYINAQLYANSEESQCQVGVCLSGLLLFENGQYLLAHIGNTRIYQVGVTGIAKLTHDHTFVENEVLKGNMHPEQVKSDPRRNMLLQCVGAFNKILPDFLCGTAKEGDSFFLCSPDRYYQNTSYDITQKSIANADTDPGIIECLANKLFSPADKQFAMILISTQPPGEKEMKIKMKPPIYEGSEPYAFVSYSHKDTHEMDEITTVLRNGGVRFWYDDGLHSGDDWNYSIATHLKNAAVCLLLLSPNSAASDYVKNELNFALNHRIPIHTLLLQSFSIPLDIELMTGRVQMVKMIGDYGKKLLSALPIEVFSFDAGTLEQVSAEYEHPLFEQKNLYLDRQGTKSYIGKHRTLNYNCAIQTDILKPGTESNAHSLALLSGNIVHPLFPRIYDIVIKNGVCRTYQEYGHDVFLDQYLASTSLSEERIIEWITNIVDGMDYLFQRNLGLRDFARGSLVVRNNTELGIFRLQNVYYGLIQLEHETKQYYFESEIQEIAILLAQLCTGATPLLPLRLIHEKHYRQNFLDIVNLVIQKCTREHGRSQYSNFAEIQRDLHKTRLSLSDRLFMGSRRKKLQRYEAAREQRREIFTASDGTLTLPQSTMVHNLEQEFGFDETVVLRADYNSAGNSDNCNGAPQIRILVCSTGQTFEFNRTTITIGRDPTLCELVWKQPYISRQHLRISRESANKYAIMDLNTSNGSYVSYAEETSDCEKIRVPASNPIDISVGAYIIIGESRFQLISVE